MLVFQHGMGSLGDEVWRDQELLVGVLVDMTACFPRAVINHGSFSRVLAKEQILFCLPCGPGVNSLQ